MRQQSKLGDPAHSFPPYLFCSGRKPFYSGGKLFVSNLQKLKRQATNSVRFFTHENCPPPDPEMPISFQLHWLINSLIGDCQCTLVPALTISNFGFFVALVICMKKYCFQRGDDNVDHENIILLALLTLPQHGDGAVSKPRQLPPRPLPPSYISVLCSSGEEGKEMIMMTTTIQETMAMLMV